MLATFADNSKPLSDAQRKAANEWYDHTLYSRLNDKRHGAIVIIMQRLHEDDLVGHVLAQEGWEILSFPAIAEADEREASASEPLQKCRKPIRVEGKCRAVAGAIAFGGYFSRLPSAENRPSGPR